MFYTKFQSPWPIFYSPSLKCIGERASVSFPHCDQTVCQKNYMILLRYHFIPHNFCRNTWRSLWSCTQVHTGYLSANKMALPIKVSTNILGFMVRNMIALGGGESKSLDCDHVGLPHTLSAIDTQNLNMGCDFYWRFGPDWWCERKLELWIPKSQVHLIIEVHLA